MPRPVIFPQNPNILTSDQNLNVALVYNDSDFGEAVAVFVIQPQLTPYTSSINAVLAQILATFRPWRHHRGQSSAAR